MSWLSGGGSPEKVAGGDGSWPLELSALTEVKKRAGESFEKCGIDQGTKIKRERERKLESKRGTT